MVIEALAPFYAWTKALHLISVFAWMAGLFYLPRLYIYHTQQAPGSAQVALFKTMERRLLRAIMNPAMIVAWIFGLAMLAWHVEAGMQGWLHAKLTAVVLMTIIHHMLGRRRKEFAEDRNTRPARYYRLLNEAPTVLLIVIVIMVIVKPF
jgi:protoporphyrinogen IX oxidase